MRKLGGVALAAAVLLVAAGCSSTEPAPTPTVTVTVTETPAPAPTVTVTVTPEALAPSEDGGEPALDEEGRQDLFLVSLAAIDPGLVVNAERALRRADDICLDIEQGWEGDAFLERIEFRLEGGNVPDLSRAQAAEVLALAEELHC